MKPHLALFDLDHTLLPIDSDYAWGQFTEKLGWVDTISFRQKNDAFFAQYQAGILNIHDYVEFATRAICEKGEVASMQAHQQFMKEVIEPVIRPCALQLIQTHRQAGHQLIVITATNEFVTRPIAHALGIEELIAVELFKDAKGWYNGGIDGVASFRDGKLTRMNQWLADHQLSWDRVETTFYTDSINDLPLLEVVNHPVVTNPSANLLAIANSRQWRVLNLFHSE
ncbi:MAG: HAD family hydrolase [Limnohabitans sp.]|nr:HAD family hydrolase [Limnohabitans sp.]